MIKKAPLKGAFFHKAFKPSFSPLPLFFPDSAQQLSLRKLLGALELA